MKSYRLQWNSGTASYFRCFESEEEREQFIKLIARKDRKGNVNYSIWESEVENDTSTEES